MPEPSRGNEKYFYNTRDYSALTIFETSHFIFSAIIWNCIFKKCLNGMDFFLNCKYIFLFPVW